MFWWWFLAHLFKILNNLKTVSQGKTTLIVSHRISSAKNADRIIIIDNGTVIQEGNHTQLVNQDGYYRELYLKQLSEAEGHQNTDNE